MINLSREYSYHEREHTIQELEIVIGCDNQTSTFKLIDACVGGVYQPPHPIMNQVKVDLLLEAVMEDFLVEGEFYQLVLGGSTVLKNLRNLRRFVEPAVNNRGTSIHMELYDSRSKRRQKPTF